MWYPHDHKDDNASHEMKKIIKIKNLLCFICTPHPSSSPLRWTSMFWKEKIITRTINKSKSCSIVKARSLSLLTCTYVGTIDCKLPSTYVGAKCYSLVIVPIIEKTYSILRVIVFDINTISCKEAWS